MSLKYCSTLVFIFLSFSLSSQCLSGDCDNGEGIWKDGTGSVYKGTFVNGTLTGIGTVTYPDYPNEGPFEAGEIKDLLVYDGALTYVGELSLGSPNGMGTLEFRSGQVIKCNWVDGDPIGIGVWTVPNTAPGANDGYEIKGPFIEWAITGNGEIAYNTGDTYRGEIVNFNEEGEGTLHFYSGGTMKGNWKEGRCINCQSAVTSTRNVIPLKKENGVFKVDVSINGVPVNNMIFDTGAGEISISPTFLMAAIENGDLDKTDILDGMNYINASGDVNYSARVNLRELTIGNKTIYNVEASICETCEGLGINLFGLNAISKLGESIEIDFNKGELRYW